MVFLKMRLFSIFNYFCNQIIVGNTETNLPFICEMLPVSSSRIKCVQYKIYVSVASKSYGDESLNSKFSFVVRTKISFLCYEENLENKKQLLHRSVFHKKMTHFIFCAPKTTSNFPQRKVDNR